MLPNELILRFVFYSFVLFSISKCQNRCYSGCTHDIDVRSLSNSSQCTVQSQACSNLQHSQAIEYDGISIRNKTGWYLYDDPNDHKYQKIGLNISWSSGRKSSVNGLQGYKITVQDIMLTEYFESDPVFETKYFCFSPNSNTNASNLIFYHDCFGYDDNLNLSPGQVLVVMIQELPKQFHNVEHEIKIPYCDDTRLKNVFECYQKNQFKAALISRSCDKKKATISYSVPPFYGDTASAILREIVPGRYFGKELEDWNNLPLSGIITVGIKKPKSKPGNYTVHILGDKIYGEQRSVAFNFSNCFINAKPNIYISIAVACTVIAVVVVFALVTVKCVCKKDLKSVLRVCSPTSAYKQKADFDKIPGLSDTVSLKVVESKSSIKVYIVFVSDHSCHRDVLLSFANYLEGDLGFNVIFELFQTNIISEDPVTWMDKNLEEADKVLVIWSPGAAERWERNKKKHQVEHDYFTPVVKAIYKDLFRSKNTQKYAFGYFEYCSVVDVPQDFRENYSQLHFKLMQEFEAVYFFLKGMEMYIPGATIKEEKVDFNHYMDNNVNKYGSVLYNKIQQACDYVQKHPLWFKEGEKKCSKTDLYLSRNEELKIESNNLEILPPPFVCSSDNSDTSVTVFTDKASKEVLSKASIALDFCDALNVDLSSDTTAVKQSSYNLPPLNDSPCPSVPNFALNATTPKSEVLAFTNENDSGYNTCSIDQKNAYKRENLLCACDEKNAKTDKNFQLVPIDCNDDPMASLISINLSSYRP